MASSVIPQDRQVHLASLDQSYTFYANTTRTVTVTATDLNLPSYNIDILDVNAYMTTSNANADFQLVHTWWATGVGIRLYLSNSTSSNADIGVKVTVLYRAS